MQAGKVAVLLLFQRLKPSLGIIHLHPCPPSHTGRFLRLTLNGVTHSWKEIKSLATETSPHQKSVSMFSSPRQGQDISSVKRYKNHMLKPSTDGQLSSFWTEYLEHLHISGPVTFLTRSLKAARWRSIFFFFLLLKSFDVLSVSWNRSHPVASMRSSWAHGCCLMVLPVCEDYWLPAQCPPAACQEHNLPSASSLPLEYN